MIVASNTSLSPRQACRNGEPGDGNCPVGRLVISVDVEDWPQSTWDHTLEITDRAVRNTELVLEILAARGKRCTMFVLGKLAEKFPGLIKRIAAAGHEIASHGYGHVQVFKQTRRQLCQDVLRAKHILEDITGQPVNGYRAPDFSIVRESIWALDVLADAGFHYDSSIYPIRHRRYGIEDWPTGPVTVQLPSGQSIVEFPLSTARIAGRRWPVAGGGYHRLLPWPVIRRAIARTVAENQPFVAYCHPYEFDPDEFQSLRLPIPLKTRLHQGLGRRGFHRKFDRMLVHFDVCSASDLLPCARWPQHTLH